MVEVNHGTSLLSITKDLLLHPNRAFEAAREKQQATVPVVFLTVIGVLGLANEALLLSKVLVTELPPIGFQGPSLALNLLHEIPATIYAYYFMESLVVTFLQGLFNFFVCWIIATFVGRAASIKGDGKSLLAFSFFSLAPLMLTGAVSLLPTAMLPPIVISSGENPSVYLTALSRNVYYLAWEYLGWAGEIWAALLTAYSTRVSHSFNGFRLASIMGLVAVITLLRIYYIF